MLQLLADRFICDRGRWFDLSTARPITVRIDRLPFRRFQFEWNDRCAVLSRLRHPLLNPLLDYGWASADVFFEAYGSLPPFRSGIVLASRAATHVVRFLRAHGVALSRDLARTIIRPIGPGGRTGRPLGIVLQPRTALDELDDTLNGGGAGPVSVSLSGPPRSGLTTVRHAFARAARLAGYVPVSVEAMQRWPELQELIAGRHLCVLSGDETGLDAHARARWLARLGIESTRRHLHVAFVRRVSAVPGSLPLDPLGVAAMTTMIYVDPDFGPSAGELLAAAHAADGWPGQFLAALRAEPFESTAASGTNLVHESSVPYRVPAAIAGVDSVAASASSVRASTPLARAAVRAASLASRGRHGAAIRLLVRAIRLLDARGERHDGAACALQAAWIARSRGETGEVHAYINRARALSDDAALQAEAAVLSGIVWTDEGRFIEAETALRSAIAAAAAIGAREIAGRASLGLARTLQWQERLPEALAALADLSGQDRPGITCEALALSARIHAAGGDVASALGAASQALSRSAVLRDLRLHACAERAMAVSLLLARDIAGAESHARSALRAAAAAHLPLATLRLRALLLGTLRGAENDARDTRQLAGALQKTLARRPLPHTVRTQIRAACESAGPACHRIHRFRRDGREVVAELVDAAQRAPDDLSAVTSVLTIVSDRVQSSSAAVVAEADGSRIVAALGRPWRERSVSAGRAITSGLPAPIDRNLQPPEAAEPIKYAGNTLAAVACRWPAGSAIDPAAAALYLGASAVALSAHVQALLDVRPVSQPSAWGDLLGDSPAAVTLREAVERAARAPFPVLIEGESGSGKELVARAIHRLGPRRDRRFCAINCAAITDELVEAELFGHARGAFTGAATERAGLFEEANGGSLFLDEVGELSARAQAKLLRVLQDGDVRRVGENFARRVDVRLIAATNRGLEQEVSASRFRADLRYRLDVVRISVPALRDRVADIPVLAAHFWSDASARVGSRATLGPETLAALARYDWPGNVRELQNTIASIAVHAPRRGRIGASMLPARLAAAAAPSGGSFEAACADFERRFVRAALAQTGGHRARTATILGVSRQGLAKMLKRLGID